MSSEFNKKLTEITENSNKIKRKEIDSTLLSEQKHLLIHQQKIALKKQLAKLDAEFNTLKAKFEKEVSFFVTEPLMQIFDKLFCYPA